MKTIKMVSMSLFLGLLLMFSAKVRAQDPVKVAPNIYKRVVLENDKVRVMEVEIAPNDTVPWHSHPDHFIYALTDGKLEITAKGAAPAVSEVKAGDAMFIEATTHMARNIGGTTVKLLVTELKNSKKMMPHKAKKTM
ncbi:cupin domain-containing protein [Pedobacter gandavensis]|uniref:cupin domain-containing protein n=1 Tax=Pedobacter gandavensis TaxID=2679963 RepID=UPI00292E8453|nr:cupin domain-containing protein [Pedobacter gandavensis]